MKKDILTLFAGFLSALILFLSTIGVTFSWFTQDSINALIWVISAFVTLVVNLYAVYKNTYVLTKKARMQKKELEKRGLK